MDELSLEVTTAPASGDPLVRVQLVPVEVFGVNECDNCDAPGGYGLCDAVPAWSDCNRAIGHIYRVDETGHREPGDVITVYVPQAELAKFEKRYGDDAGDRCPACH